MSSCVKIPQSWGKKKQGAPQTKPRRARVNPNPFARFYRHGACRRRRVGGRLRRAPFFIYPPAYHVVSEARWQRALIVVKRCRSRLPLEQKFPILRRSAGRSPDHLHSPRETISARTKRTKIINARMQKRLRNRSLKARTPKAEPRGSGRGSCTTARPLVAKAMTRAEWVGVNPCFYQQYVQNAYFGGQPAWLAPLSNNSQNVVPPAGLAQHRAFNAPSANT